MRLSARYNRVNLITSLIILLFTGIIYYSVIHFILANQLDKDLLIEEDEILEYTHSYNKLPLPGNFKDQKVSYKLLNPGSAGMRKFTDTEYQNTDHRKKEPGRSLVTSLKLNNQLYLITITKSKLPSEDLVRIIFLITLGIIALLLISLALINRFILNRMWQPFYNVLEQMKAFNIAGKNEITPDPTNINEFNELNMAAISMSNRVKQDYKDLRSFTDNASHEMMTPLAVINSKLDTFLQVEPLNAKQGELIDDIYDSIGRLSRLNQSLLLLAKLENHLIHEKEPVSLKELIEQKLKQFQELIQANRIIVSYELEEKEVIMSKFLADILLNNLISNAIRHNIKAGNIYIKLQEDQLTFSNSGADGSLDEKQAFKRFYKSPSSEGLGLGLAISKQICSLNSLQLNYSYESGIHTFTVTF